MAHEPLQAGGPGTRRRGDATRRPRPLIVSWLAVLAFLFPSLWHAAAAQAGTTVDQPVVGGSQWLFGQGVNAYRNVYGDHGTDSGWGTEWQCVELAQRLYSTKGWYPYTHFSGISAASQIYPDAAALGFEAHRNGTGIPVPGDLIIHSGTPGHVAVVDRVDGSTVHVVEQNASSTDTAAYTLTGSTLSRPGWSSPVGYVHSPRNPFSNAKQVSVARRADGAQDLLVRGTDGAAWLLGLDANGAVVQPWRSLGGQVLGAPSASWSGDGSHLDVYAVGTDRQMYHDRYDLGQDRFSGWGLVPGNGQAGSGTVEVARNPRDDSMDLLVRGTDSVPYDLRLDAGSQQLRGWVSLGGVVMGAPSGTWSSSGYRLDVYAVGSDWQMYHDSYDTLEPSFNGWGLVGGGGQAGSPTVEAARRWDDGVDLLVKGTDNAGYDLQLDSVGSVVRGWVSLGGIVQGAPTGAYVPSSMHLDVYAVGSDAQMYHDSSDNGLPIGWGTSLPGGFSGWSLVPGAGSAG